MIDSTLPALMPGQFNANSWLTALSPKLILGVGVQYLCFRFPDKPGAGSTALALSLLGTPHNGPTSNVA
jgi:hypothetical protein